MTPRPFLRGTACLLLTLVACGRAVYRGDETAAFERLNREFLADYFRHQPVAATAAGEHAYDDKLDDRSPEAMATWISTIKRYEARYSAFDPRDLNPEQLADRAMVRNWMQAAVFEHEELEDWKRNPLGYTALAGNGLFGLMARDFAPVRARLTNALARLRQIPGLLGEARANLEHPPAVHVETAIQQNEGNVNLIDRDLRALVAAQAPEMKAEFEAAAAPALAALASYGEWLKTDLARRADGDFRLGENAWKRKLGYTLQTDFEADELLRRAESELPRLHDEMFRVALPLYRRDHPGEPAGLSDAADSVRVVRAVLDSIADDHTLPTELLAEVRRAVREAEAFARDRGFVSLPDEPLEVIEVPEFMRGVAVAYCDSPGPLERHLNAFYMVSPPPAQWSAAQTESFLREYNRWMIREVTVHEAIPGHFVQGAHANRHPSLLRAVFPSPTFTEGWAVYAERKMAEAGFTGDPRLRLMQLKMALRATINTILDRKIHTQGMTEAEAMRLMMEDGFQEEGEAAGKWRRACLTATQLSTYFAGLQEWLDLRRESERRAAARGAGFDERQFHDRALSFGALAPRLLRPLLLAAEAEE